MAMLSLILGCMCAGCDVLAPRMTPALVLSAETAFSFRATQGHALCKYQPFMERMKTFLEQRPFISEISSITSLKYRAIKAFDVVRRKQPAYCGLDTKTAVT